MASEMMKQKIYFMQEDNERKKREAQLNEFERLRNNLDLLREKLKEDGLDQETIDDLKEDIAGMRNKKRELGRLLGYN